MVFHAADGTTVAEFIDEPVGEALVSEGMLPRLALVLHARQRTVAHLLVEIDRAGADIHAFDGGKVLGRAQIEGDTEHIHRGHPGGWSHRRFQQHAGRGAASTDVADVTVLPGVAILEGPIAALYRW
jgi:hypothetical protein